VRSQPLGFQSDCRLLLRDHLTDLTVTAMEREGNARAAEAAVKAHAANRAAADKLAANVLPIVRDIQAAGHTTLREIAESLNARGVRTARRALRPDETIPRGRAARIRCRAFRAVRSRARLQPTA